ncbi:5-methylcytosine-specific restriction endonuclease McrA [Klenkia marina]|uniref:5-methylcytosine-specific restriction endonuclease McrA n=1 Tax=Klenkia marina TaxID=1960309 RepID=A0A1G4XPN4_9ACTN|nr:HNH endonuclease signature motif containing protein [Klenkia marina]SCX43075.1 5-methylcytosine-specific restriction endonuclease McrA [Klenkia marina]
MSDSAVLPAPDLDLLVDDVETLHHLSSVQVLDQMRELMVERNRLDAVLARLGRHAELTQAVQVDGLVSVRSWLIGHLHLSGTEASRIVRVGRAVEHFPQLGEAFADGSVSAAQVDVVASAVGDRERAAAQLQGIDLGVFDRAWTQVAVTSSHRALVTAVQAFVEALDPDGVEPDPVQQRALSISTHADGSVTGRFDLDAVGGEKVKTALESIVQADRPEGDLRTRVQRQADALVALADRQLGAGVLPVLRSVKPHVVVTIGVEDLVADGTGPATASMGFGATISAARARWLACDATVSRIVMGPEGTPLDVGRTHRVVTPGLRRAVVARDQTCVFAGCGAPHHWADVHHLVHWAHGGETSLANSALLCEPHHTKVHHGFRVERDPGGRWRTHRPDDTEIITGPRTE